MEGAIKLLQGRMRQIDEYIVDVEKDINAFARKEYLARKQMEEFQEEKASLQAGLTKLTEVEQ